ncbi:MAG TPA: DUF4255 domain-containing protein [Nitrospirae bacterium]|nr:DUF4255 domain-containing protein [Nitrospirota bacterium]
MADFTVIGDVGETLKRLLESDDLWSGISPKPDITLKSPYEIKEDSGSPNKVSIFLYHVEQNSYMRNLEPERVDEETLKMPPLTLDLYYLVTPYSDDKTQEKTILGKVMQIFHDNTILTGPVLYGSLALEDMALKLFFNPISIDDMTKLWSAFQDTPYRLSVTYLVTPVRIDSTKEIDVKRVLSREDIYSEIRRR